MTWQEAGPGQLAFSRSADDAVLTCVVNLSGAPARIDGYGHPVVASTDLTAQDDGHVLPVDAAAWFERR